MKNQQPSSWLAVAAVIGCFLIAVCRAEETAVVKDPRVNVRGQPTIFSEVITQLQKGETVTILETVTNSTAKLGDPAEWARIQMPSNTPVWIFASMIDPTNKTVKVSRLNVRAGPGENYSVVGRMEQGTEVKEIRTVEDWMEIETPQGAYAFLAMELLVKTNAPDAAPALEKEIPAVAKTETTPPPPVVEEKPAPTAPQTVEKTLTQEPPPATPPAVSSTQTTQTNKVTAPPAGIEKTNPPPIIAQAPAQQPPPAAVKQEPATPPVVKLPPARRIVRREGIVRSTFSIQAPTYFELVSPETRKTINWLHSESPDLDLREFKGQRVIVTGEEGIDARWPNTPLVEVETIQAIP